MWNDVHIALSEFDPVDSTIRKAAIELVVGGWANTKSCVRPACQSPGAWKWSACVIPITGTKTASSTDSDKGLEPSVRFTLRTTGNRTGFVLTGGSKVFELNPQDIPYEERDRLRRVTHVQLSSWNTWLMYTDITVLPDC